MAPTLSHSPSTVPEVPVDTTTASAASVPALGSEPATTTETTGAVVVETSIATAAEAQAAEAHADHAAEAKADTSTEDSDAQAAERAARAAQRKALKQRCHGHASHGASSYYYSVPAGREALPVPPESEREKICSFQPTCAPQNIRLRKYLRTVRTLEVTAPDGTVTLIKLKPGTYEEHLALSQVTELLRASKRDLLEESMHDRFIAPAGLLPEDHHRVTYLINSLGPTHILAWARDIELPVYQALAQEVVGAWHDPFAEGLECCRREVPLRPNATALKPYQQALSERAAHWPEALRPLLGDLIKVLKECLPSKLHDYLVLLQRLLQLSSQDLHAALLTLGQSLPKFFALAALVKPQAWEQSGCDMHQFLQATSIQLKKATKKTSKKTSAKADAKAEAKADAKTETKDSTKAAKANTKKRPQAAPKKSKTSRKSAAKKAKSAQPAASAPSTPEGSASVASSVPEAQVAPEALSGAASQSAPEEQSGTSEPKTAAAYPADVHLELEEFMGMAEGSSSDVAEAKPADAAHVEAKLAAAEPADAGASGCAFSTLAQAVRAVVADHYDGAPVMTKDGLKIRIVEVEDSAELEDWSVVEDTDLADDDEELSALEPTVAQLSAWDSSRGHKQRKQQRKLQRKQRKQARRHHK